MINYMQTNQDSISNNYIISNINHEHLYKKITICNQDDIYKYINNLSRDYNLDKKSIIKIFINYYIKEYNYELTKEKLLFIKKLLHSGITNTELFMDYFVTGFTDFFSDKSL